MLLMMKDRKVLETMTDGSLRVYDRKLLPFALQKDDLTYEDFIFNWLAVRPLSMGRSNAKEILNNSKIPQTPLTIAKISHAFNLTDCYWVREEEETITWESGNLYDHPMDQEYADTALTGMHHSLNREKIHTPELTSQGVSAKCWIQEPDGIYLYKVGRKELPASEILQQLGISHVVYERAGLYQEYLSKERLKRIEQSGEVIVKSKLITSKKMSIVSFEEFAVWCANQEKDEFEEARKLDSKRYYEMQIADYILNNSDRHVGNWGFYFKTDENVLTAMHPLMDHDHAFDENEILMPQTWEGKTLLEAAVCAQKILSLPLIQIFQMEQPEYLKDQEWHAVKERVQTLLNECE